MSAANRVERQHDLFLYLRAHSGQHFTIAELARAVGRCPNGSFRVDLSAVRHLAQENGEIVTNCSMERRPNGDVVQTLHHHKPENENGETVRPLATQGRQAATRVRNQGRQAAFTARHGVHPTDRKEAGLYVRVTKASEALLDMIDATSEIREQLETLAQQAAFAKRASRERSS